MKAIRKIACIGAGYVGGPTMAVIADQCPEIEVVVIDLNPQRIAAWNSDKLPVFEPGLKEVIQRTRGRNLKFITQDQGDQVIAEADAIFISVNTPTKTHGAGAGKASDLSYVEACAHYIAKHAAGHTIVIEKSTMPVRAAETIKRILESNAQSATFDILSNPEFLAEGTAIKDLEKPDRVLIGGEDALAIEALAKVYTQWVPEQAIIRTGLWSAELSKLAANAFLAQRVSSINAISALCEVTGARVDEVAKVLGTDSRIGPKFLRASVGFGGSCFKKDLLSLIYICEFYGLTEPASYWQSVLELNDWQKLRFANLAAAHARQYGGAIAVLGLAFKKNTNDFRESPAIDICNHLLASGISLRLQDEQVNPTTFLAGLENKYQVNLNFYPDVETAVHGASAVLILTEWESYTTLDWNKLAKSMTPQALVIDGRSITQPSQIREAGLSSFVVGQGSQIK
jgi:UDPglucose 6-dehydrogenase